MVGKDWCFMGLCPYEPDNTYKIKSSCKKHKPYNRVHPACYRYNSIFKTFMKPKKQITSFFVKALVTTLKLKIKYYEI